MRAIRKPSVATVKAHRSNDQSDQNAFIIDETLGALISVAARLMDRSLNARLLVHGVSFGTWPVLLWLWAEDGVKQTILSRRVGIDDATMVRTIDRMERDGFVRRSRNPQNRREINVYLTPKAIGLKPTLLPCALEVNRLATDALTQEELAVLLQLLARIGDRLRSELSQQPGLVRKRIAVGARSSARLD